MRDAHAAHHRAVGQAFPEHPIGRDYPELADELIVRARLARDTLARVR